MNKKIKPPALSTVFSENEKSVKKRLENILNTGARKKGAVILVLAFCVIAAVGILIACIDGSNVAIIGGSDGPTSIYISKENEKYEITELESAITQAILSDNANGYLKGECAGEGHIILGTGDSKEWYNGDKDIKFIEAYVLTTYGEYGYENGKFAQISGSGILPVRITFEVYPDGRYNLLEYKEALDGEGCAQSIKDMFPETYWNRALKVNPEDYAACKKQESAYALKYLKSIGKKDEMQSLSDGSS